MGLESQNRAVTLITGASDGIGAELAHVFAANGHELVLVARRQDKLQALADQIKMTSGKAPLVIALDLIKPDAVSLLVAQLNAAGLSIQYLINNAGFGLMGRIAELNTTEQLDIVKLNSQALTALTLEFLPQLIQHKGGLLNVASVAAFMPGPGFTIYYATKAYVRSFTEGLAEELKPFGVKVSCLCPGPVATGFQARAGFDFSGSMGAMKPAMLSARVVAQQGYAGLMAGKRIVIPGVVNKLLVFFARLTPRSLLLPILAAAQKKR
jgi:short-subunit dehydrogenase